MIKFLNSVFISRKILPVCFLVWLCLQIPGANAASTKVRFWYFSNRACSDCQLIKQEFLPKIFAKYQNQLEMKTMELASIENFQLLLNLEKQMRRKLPKTPPLIIMGDDVLEGEAVIRSQLEPTINKYLKTGGTEWPL